VTSNEEKIMNPEWWLKETISADRTRRQLTSEWNPTGERRRRARRSPRRRIEER
jgi:hypothetical protein